MTSLGFENYAEALKIYLSKYREVSFKVSQNSGLQYFSGSRLTLCRRLNPLGARIDQEAKVKVSDHQVAHRQQSQVDLKEPTTFWEANQERELNTIQVRTETCTEGRQATTAQLVEMVTRAATGIFEYIGVKVLIWRRDGQRANVLLSVLINGHGYGMVEFGWDDGWF
jgi:hypothetical protein